MLERIILSGILENPGVSPQRTHPNAAVPHSESQCAELAGSGHTLPWPLISLLLAVYNWYSKCAKEKYFDQLMGEGSVFRSKEAISGSLIKFTPPFS